MDTPKSLASAAEQSRRLARLRDSHIAALSSFVDGMRVKLGPTYAIPYFDPLDGGADAECLFLLEAPGPNAVKSGFVSRNNPDETAKNFFLLNQQALIERQRTAVWNVVPWYVGSGTKIRPANARDISEGLPFLERLLQLLPQLTVVVLVGAKAARIRAHVATAVPEARIFLIPHPSPMFVNRSPRNRELLLAALNEVSSTLRSDRLGQAN